MKKNQLFALAFATIMSGLSVKAQNVGINEDGSLPNSNAILDVKSSTKGILIPRVSTAAKLVIPNTKGMLIYDTTANSFWYNNGAGWIDISAPANGWALTGNTVTNDSSFIGTLNGKAFQVKSNNFISGFIGNDLNTNTTWGYQNGGMRNLNAFFNTAIGYQALKSNTTGSENTAIGAHSLILNTTGFSNTVIGDQAMRNNVSGFHDIAIGSRSLENNTTGSFNIAIGNVALGGNVSGNRNVVIGFESFPSGQTGLDNVAIGYQSLLNSREVNRNTATGSNSLISNVTGSNNTAYGYVSMFNPTDGTGNTCLGAFSDMVSGLSNATAVGFGATVTVSNKVRIGNPSVTRIEGQVPFTTPSDGRFKFQVKEDVKGLDFILQLRPVTYQFDVKRFDAQERKGMKNSEAMAVSDAMKASYDQASAIRRSGFIAQEVEKAAVSSGYDFSGILKPTSSDDHYSLSYESFVVPLVKAVQEQQKLIIEMQKQIDDLKFKLQGSK